MKKRLIRSVSVLLALITVLSCFSAVPFSAAEISDPETESSGLKIGDVNADGVVNINDCTHLQKYLADLVGLDDAQKKVADTNGDGKITILDATKIQKVIARLDDFSVVTDETDEKTFTKGEWVYHIEAFSVDGDSNYYADANVDVKKNQTVKCTLTGAVRRVPGKGSLCVTCVAESSGQQLEVTAITLYDNNNTQIITCKGNPFTFDNVPKGLYYVEVNATKNGVKYHGTSYKLPVFDGQKTSFTFEVPKRVEKEAEQVPKIESQKVTFSYDRSMFKDPRFDIIISKNPIDSDYDYITTDSTWWFYHTYEGEDGWYYQDALNGWRYITDESLDPGIYYLALFITEGDDEEEGEEKIEVRIPFATVAVDKDVLFRFKVNPDSGQVIYKADTWTPEFNPPSIVV